MIQEIKTYADLLAALQQLTPEQLHQPVQTIKMHPSHEHVYECCPVCVISTIGDLEIEYARSSVDNRFNPDEIVLFTDGNMFGIDGVFSYIWNNDGTDTPTYVGGKYDPTTDWTGPAQKLLDAQRARLPGHQKLSAHTIVAIKSALRNPKSE